MTRVVTEHLMLLWRLSPLPGVQETAHTTPTRAAIRVTHASASGLSSSSARTLLCTCSARSLSVLWTTTTPAVARDAAPARLEIWTPSSRWPLWSWGLSCWKVRVKLSSFLSGRSGFVLHFRVRWKLESASKNWLALARDLKSNFSLDFSLYSEFLDLTCQRSKSRLIIHSITPAD